jgi:hypothetical protein
MKKSSRPDTPTRAVFFKWLHAGAIDPQGRFAWPTDKGRPGSWVSGSWVAMPGISGSRLGGLPYEIDQELWLVELDELIAAVPFSIPQELGELDGLVEQSELRLLARRGRLLTQVPTWTLRAAQEFAAECAAEARGRVLEALRDAEHLVEVAATDDLALVPTRQTDGPSRAIDPSPGGHAIGALRHAEILARIWRDAVAEAASNEVHLGAAFASAAALCRAAVARTYAESLEPSSLPRAQDVALHAYLEERRRQARWLQSRLGLGEAIHEAARAA